MIDRNLLNAEPAETKTFTLKHVSEDLNILCVLKGTESLSEAMRADALEQYARHIRGGADAVGDFKASNGVCIIRSRQRFERRTLVISLAADLPESERFVSVVALALREYANSLDAGEFGNEEYETIRASNGCTLAVISGINVIR